MTSNDTSESDILLERAKSVIPGGIFGHYKYAVRPSGPKFFSRAEGAHFWDVDNNQYIDYMCAYGPMILGYNHPVVDEAARKQHAEGNTVSLAAPVMIDLAETLVDMVDAADWALFGKNGGDATTLAVMVARAATGREKIIKIDEGYHGVTAWMQAGRPGTIEDDGAHVITLPWNDVDALESALTANPGEIACFISSPYDHPVMRDNTLPREGYWASVEALCRKHGIVLIIDEVRSGFRVDLAGAHSAYGFTPDLICFGKGLGNGYPISALVGNDALKGAADSILFTGTQFFNAVPMAAAKATLEELKKNDAANTMTRLGTKLNEGLVNVASQHGYRLNATGIPAMPYYRLDGIGFEAHTVWIDECVKHGAYFLNYHNHFLSTAHTDADIERTCNIASDAFTAMGSPDRYQG